jgi:HAD superfamily hydrolase (TIGR01509 family)
MNIIIPLGGKGERFSKAGYNDPKPLIKIFGKPMILYVLDHLKMHNEDQIFIIYYQLDKTILEHEIKKKYPSIYFIKLEEQTKGASETLYKGLPEIMKITTNTKTMLFDCDTFYTQDVITMYRNFDFNAVFYNMTNEEKPIFSYIETDSTNKILKIEEKNKISNKANTGIYCFREIQELYHYSKIVVEKNITFKNEPYISCIIDQMSKNNDVFYGIELDPTFVFNLGTPQQVNEYVNNTYLFLFDLDGTLVLSEAVYFEVWKQLLLEYNIVLTKELFNQYISGNNDSVAINHLLPQCKLSTEEFSKRKDELFIENIDKIVLIEGVHNIVKEIYKKGHKLAIVTNCNRLASEKILDYFQLTQFFEFIVIGNECSYPKPYPDPYLKAINKFDSTNDKAIIFEDSKSGLLSANAVSPKCIVGIESLYSKEELINHYADITIKNYINFDIDYIIQYTKLNYLWKNTIKKIMKSDIQNIIIGNTKMKGGFISDVLEVTIVTENKNISCVIKVENKKENFLTIMSNHLELYNREYYFYDSISKFIPIKTPQFYGLLKDDHGENIGILMENINKSNFKLNLNLNHENLSVSLKIIDSLSLLHSTFWEKDMTMFKELKKNNDSLFKPFWNNFIQTKWPEFKQKWSRLLTSNNHLELAEYIVTNYNKIQDNLSDKNLTLCHGDVKSPNIFYKIENDYYEPYFIDWQYIVRGKGVQDLVFLMIESFEPDKIILYKDLFKEYYYTSLIKNGVTNYTKEDYEKDFKNASFYFPFFVAIWFGTISEDELIDKEFPEKFIKKLFHFYTL